MKSAIIVFMFFLLCAQVSFGYGEASTSKKTAKQADEEVSVQEGNNAFAEKSAELKVRDFMYDPDALIKFERLLNEIERSFWKAASLSRTAPFVMDFDRKIFTLTSLARTIQGTLIHEEKFPGINVPNGAISLSDAWHRFSGSGSGIYRTAIKNTSRRDFKKYDSEDKDAYLEWLSSSINFNIEHFAYKDDKMLKAKVSSYFMAIETLRRDIVTVSELGLFKENSNLVPKLSSSNKSSKSAVKQLPKNNNNETPKGALFDNDALNRTPKSFSVYSSDRSSAISKPQQSVSKTKEVDKGALTGDDAKEFREKEDLQQTGVMPSGIIAPVKEKAQFERDSTVNQYKTEEIVAKASLRVVKKESVVNYGPLMPGEEPPPPLPPQKSSGGLD